MKIGLTCMKLVVAVVVQAFGMGVSPCAQLMVCFPWKAMCLAFGTYEHRKVNDSNLAYASRRFDVPTFLGRDLDKCITFAKAWYGKANNLPESSSTVRFLEFPLNSTNGPEASLQNSLGA